MRARLAILLFLSFGLNFSPMVWAGGGETSLSVPTWNQDNFVDETRVQKSRVKEFVDELLNGRMRVPAETQESSSSSQLGSSSGPEGSHDSE